ncbi:deoxyribodipyrimidine photo-lyase type I [Hoeflea marina]|uniref:Deoxyribodipyrimidine photo-lyase n=1 Tax=Hoeflea marina TaxID=274592 RepID=A0A317PRX3_9HYPH|nr:deoxyribodipyrimidine photo-lyase [Hoeflea marina]PWW04223.1 deoxyribodipyrimidine photo-lyase type I [Hoeflea marina]
MKDETVRMPGVAIVWLRDDLRVADNAALFAGSAHEAVLPVYIRQTASPARPRGAAAQWWLHHSLEQLAARLEALGSPLTLLSGDPFEILAMLVVRFNASAVYWNRSYDPARSAADARVKSCLTSSGLRAVSFPGQLLHEPTRLRTGGGGHYRVYTPFWRALEAGGEPRPPQPAPERLVAPDLTVASEALSDWKLLPTTPDWAGGLRDGWSPGEAGARARLNEFLGDGIADYAEGRDIPSVDNTSRLSPHLAHGEITPAQIFEALAGAETPGSDRDELVFRKEVGWREFSWHLLVNEPDLPRANHNRRFDAFPWAHSPVALEAWEKGLTGYPIVDAGMRQLWKTGWMHNRVRMIAASFLTKHLLIDWRRGEEWFWDTLVDADPASNAASWQWVAGCGADASPYFRIFNPILQGEKFDPDGAYVRAFVPELSKMPAKFIHKPWEAPRSILSEAGVRLGRTYPEPIVDHKAARDRALSAYNQIKGAA